jgi:hypothetical protein
VGVFWEDAMRKLAAARLSLARRLGLDRNELSRASDRIEAWLLLALIVAFVPLAVLTTSAVAQWVHDAGARAWRAKLSLRQVTAVLLPGGRRDKLVGYRFVLVLGASSLDRSRGDAYR